MVVGVAVVDAIRPIGTSKYALACKFFAADASEGAMYANTWYSFSDERSSVLTEISLTPELFKRFVLIVSSTTVCPLLFFVRNLTTKTVCLWFVAV